LVTTVNIGLPEILDLFIKIKAVRLVKITCNFKQEIMHPFNKIREIAYRFKRKCNF